MKQEIAKVSSEIEEAERSQREAGLWRKADALCSCWRREREKKREPLIRT